MHFEMSLQFKFFLFCCSTFRCGKRNTVCVYTDSQMQNDVSGLRAAIITFHDWRKSTTLTA